MNSEEFSKSFEVSYHQVRNYMDRLRKWLRRLWPEAGKRSVPYKFAIDYDQKKEFGWFLKKNNNTKPSATKIKSTL